ncbi:diguanylate cyclase [Vibrio chagasii]|nr:diguanylate cyclase [Vibrio chagasii]
MNDTYGHDGGDAVLIEVGKIIKQHFKDDLPVRFGGRVLHSIMRPFEQFVEVLESMRDAN